MEDAGMVRKTVKSFHVKFKVSTNLLNYLVAIIILQRLAQKVWCYPGEEEFLAN